MKYRNLKTGQVVVTTGRVCGENWELISGGPDSGTSQPKAEPKPAASKPKGKKK